MSEWTEIGCLDAFDGSALAIAADGERVRLSFSSPGGRKAVIDLSAEAYAEFRELLDRAAMPGQVSG